MTLNERIENYERVTGYPRSMMVGGDGRLVGMWLLGQNYQVASKYHGGFPHGFLPRLRALFPDRANALHLFSGAVDLAAFPGKTCDINPQRQPDYVDDAQTLQTVPLESFDIVVADPPYADEDAARYGTTPIKRNKVMRTLGTRCAPGTVVCWLDTFWPMYRKDQFNLIGVIGIMRSTNHRIRSLTIYERTAAPQDEVTGC